MAKKPTAMPVADDESVQNLSEPKRPGTSGTELLLTTNRRTASAQYLAAQRAETAYKAKKRSEGARSHRTEAKDHFKQSTHHFKEGWKSCFMMVKAVPWMVKDWRAKRQTENEKKAVERYMEKKKKIEERIAEQEAKETGEAAAA
ncbi:hypothetical protein P280DRAFT_475263 [Massarina eburnea CBS 473.64]|uniref:Uncharacterized protein n=1 Tax=Massarina eburnea CBS 473.64 TaxID=1395130 RepID=A0A6A6SFM8_9PLEO|nr:hypothetical protein P280DRAFT_475263 [Massarina eburnea CBS 473.64]